MANIWESLKNSIKPIKPIKRSPEQIKKQRENVASYFSGKSESERKKDLQEKLRRRRKK